MKHMNRTTRWDKTPEIPSGWGHVTKPNWFERLEHKFYERLQWMRGGQPVGETTFRSFYGLPHQHPEGRSDQPKEADDERR
jgi:hypothetical protein